MDSGTGPARDPFLAPAPIAPDSNASVPAQPQSPREAVKLSTQGSFSLANPQVGDSLDYTVAVEWEDTGIPVFVLAPDSLDFPGFKLIGQATVHKKLAAGASVRNHTEFIFRLRAMTQGTGKASAMKVRYLTGLSKQEEALFIPTALTDIGAAPAHLLDMLWFKLLLWLLGLGLAVAAAYAAFRWSLKRKAAKVRVRADLRPEAAALKQRLRSAQNSPDASKAILSEMESLAMRFLKDELAGNGDANLRAAGRTGGQEKDAAGAALRFDPLLDRYLARTGAGIAPSAEGGAADWAKLRDLFRHARFAGGYKEPHELQDAFRTFRKCLKLTGDDDHE
ncbi:MAG: hypothetical protein ABI036_04505 [Fibrobacteria bacterium]